MARTRTGVYCILNTINSKRYIGSSSSSIKSRFNQHQSVLRRNRHSNRHLQHAWNKYGENVFQFLYVQDCLPEECAQVEEHWIKHYKCCDRKHGYNICPIPGSSTGRKLSDEHKFKIGLGGKGKKHSEVTKKRQSEGIRRFIKRNGWHTKEGKTRRLMERTKAKAKQSRKRYFLEHHTSPDGLNLPEWVGSHRRHDYSLDGVILGTITLPEDGTPAFGHYRWCLNRPGKGNISGVSISTGNAKRAVENRYYKYIIETIVIRA